MQKKSDPHLTDRLNVPPVDTEDKLAWCESGQQFETAFVTGRLFELGVAGFLNPEKRTNPYVHDLFVQFPADLKTVRTPLFKAMELFGIDPQYAVTFNIKDAIRYKGLYPNIVVIFDVRWEGDSCSMRIDGQDYSVEPMNRTYSGFLRDIHNAVVKGGRKKIEYKNRVNDVEGNAKESYVFDVRELHLLKKPVDF